jgi:hypothetical protein
MCNNIKEILISTDQPYPNFYRLNLSQLEPQNSLNEPPVCLEFKVVDELTEEARKQLTQVSFNIYYSILDEKYFGQILIAQDEQVIFFNIPRGLAQEMTDKMQREIISLNQSYKLFRPGATITAVYVNEYRSTSRECYIPYMVKDQWRIKNSKTKLVDHISVLSEALVFHGTDLPFKTDAQFNAFSSNGTINLVAEAPAATVRNWITDKNLNRNFSDWKNIRLCNGDPLDLLVSYSRLFQ